MDYALAVTMVLYKVHHVKRLDDNTVLVTKMRFLAAASSLYNVVLSADCYVASSSIWGTCLAVANPF